jgi:hypothetical protein
MIYATKYKQFDAGTPAFETDKQAKLLIPASLMLPL